MRAFVCGLLLLLCPFPGAGRASADEPFRVEEALRFPEWLSLSVDHRTRFESLQGDFRGGQKGDAQALVLRTLVHGRLRPRDWLTLGAELLDARAVAKQSSTEINTTSVNTAELLQGYLELRGAWPGEARSLLRAGRITMDLGSRRLVARNRYRNTINGFTGIDARTQWGEGNELRAFWVLPVQRLPDDEDRLRDNEVKFDDESFDVQLAGLFGATALPWGGRIEGFALGLVEDDAPDRNPRNIRNRKLLTPGFRAYRAPSRGAFDYQLESVIQFGRSRLSTSSRRNLDHLAHFHHAELGYSFDAPLSPRVLAQFDYASGDRKPDDGKNQRFDTLYGARRFDFGPTGIYGPFARSNLITPGLRVQLRPLERVSSFVSFRSFWLASKKDGVSGMDLSDPSGNSGRYVASQIEMRVRYDLVPRNLRLEGGYARLFEGEFMRDAPQSNGQGDADYFYFQVRLWL